MPRCSQVKANGDPCRAWAMRGSDRCSFHLNVTRGGRHTLLTPQVADQLVTMLRAGNYIAVAVRAVGINRRTLTEWMRRGRTGLPADEPYRELRERIHQAQAEGEVRNVAQIAKAATDSWAAAAWLLERQHPTRWGRVSTRLRLEAADDERDAPVNVDTDDPFAEVDELAERRRARRGE